MSKSKLKYQYPWPPVEGQRVQARRGLAFADYEDLFQGSGKLFTNVGKKFKSRSGQIFGYYEAVVVRVNGSGENLHGLSTESYDVYFDDKKRKLFNVFVELEALWPIEEAMNPEKNLFAQRLVGDLSVCFEQRKQAFAAFFEAKKKGGFQAGIDYSALETDYTKFKDANEVAVLKYNKALPKPEKVFEVKQEYEEKATAARLRGASPWLMGHKENIRFGFVGGNKAARKERKKAKEKKEKEAAAEAQALLIEQKAQKKKAVEGQKRQMAAMQKPGWEKPQRTKTSNIAKYKLGQQVRMVGADGELVGKVVSIFPEVQGEHVGPGYIMIQPDQKRDNKSPEIIKQPAKPVQGASVPKPTMLPNAAAAARPAVEGAPKKQRNRKPSAAASPAAPPDALAPSTGAQFGVSSSSLPPAGPGGKMRKKRSDFDAPTSENKPPPPTVRGASKPAKPTASAMPAKPAKPAKPAVALPGQKTRRKKSCLATSHAAPDPPPPPAAAAVAVALAVEVEAGAGGRKLRKKSELTKNGGGGGGGSQPPPPGPPHATAGSTLKEPGQAKQEEGAQDGTKDGPSDSGRKQRREEGAQDDSGRKRTLKSKSNLPQPPPRASRKCVPLVNDLIPAQVVRPKLVQAVLANHGQFGEDLAPRVELMTDHCGLQVFDSLSGKELDCWWWAEVGSCSLTKEGVRLEVSEVGALMLEVLPPHTDEQLEQMIRPWIKHSVCTLNLVEGVIEGKDESKAQGARKVRLVVDHFGVQILDLSSYHADDESEATKTHHSKDRIRDANYNEAAFWSWEDLRQVTIADAPTEGGSAENKAVKVLTKSSGAFLFGPPVCFEEGMAASSAHIAPQEWATRNKRTPAASGSGGVASSTAEALEQVWAKLRMTKRYAQMVAEHLVSPAGLLQ
jgi:hypothetical protein